MQPQLSHVVVAYDFTKSAAPALHRALALAARAPVHVLHFVCVIDPNGSIPAVPHRGPISHDYAGLVQRELTSVIARELRAAAIADRIMFYVHTRIGAAAEEIQQLAREVGAELIIVGTKGASGMQRLLLGSIAAQVMRDAHCTVEVAKPMMYPLLGTADSRDYVPPHRYMYDQTCASLRPDEWPIS